MLMIARSSPIILQHKSIYVTCVGPSCRAITFHEILCAGNQQYDAMCSSVDDYCTKLTQTNHIPSIIVIFLRIAHQDTSNVNLSVKWRSCNDHMTRSQKSFYLSCYITSILLTFVYLSRNYILFDEKTSKRIA